MPVWSKKLSLIIGNPFYILHNLQNPKSEKLWLNVINISVFFKKFKLICFDQSNIKSSYEEYLHNKIYFKEVLNVIKLPINVKTKIYQNSNITQMIFKFF